MAKAAKTRLLADCMFAITKPGAISHFHEEILRDEAAALPAPTQRRKSVDRSATLQ